MKLLKILSILLFFTLVFSCDAGGTEVNNNNGTENPDNPDNGGDDPETPTVPEVDLKFSVISETTKDDVFMSAVESVVVDGTTIYAGTQSNGLYVSKDSGTTWKNYLFNLTTTVQVKKIALYGNYVFVGLRDRLIIWDPALDIFTETLEFTYINDLLVDNNILYIASNKGLHISNPLPAEYINVEINTLKTSADGLPVDKVEALYISGNTLYLATEDEDSGFNVPANPILNDLTVVNKDWSNTPASYDVVSYSPRITNIFVLDSNIIVNADFSLKVSNDGGTNYADKITTNGGSVTGFAYDNNTLYCSKYGNDLFYSKDLGQNWKSVTIPGYDGFTGIIANDVFATNGKVYIAHSKGLVIGQLK